MKKSQSEYLVNRAIAILVTASLVVAFSLICEVPRARAQSAVATLSGTVEDPNGAVVPGVTVTILNPGTGFAREATTNDAGIYTFPSLAPGNYSVTARGGGFPSVEIKDVVLNVNDRRSLQIQLKLGQVGEIVQVTDEASLINESSAVATTIDRQFVENLPLNGRSFQGLVALSPGVVITGTSGAEQGQFSVNGQRTASNSFSIDGVSANFGGIGTSNLQQSAAGALPAVSAQGGTNSLVSVDAVQEFTIQTSSYAPEFGRTPGAQVSILTRSGTNDFHGSVFEYYRHDALDANDFFANSRGLPKAALRVNDYGGVIGGPVYLPRFGEGGPAFLSGKNRTFFFFSYEALPLTLPQTRLTQVPTLALRQNSNLSEGLRAIINAYPLPNGPVLATDSDLAEFNASFSDRSDLTSYSLRLDHNLTSRFQLFGRYSNAPSNRISRAPGQTLAASTIQDSDFNTRTLTLGSTWSISDSLINDLRFNYSTQKVNSTTRLDNFGGAVPFNASAFFTTPQPFTEEESLFSFFLLSGTNASLLLGKDAETKQRQLNVVDNLFVVKGSHSFKFGGDYRRLSPIYGPRDFQAQIYFQQTADVLPPRDPVTGAFLRSSSPYFSIIESNQPGTLFFNNFGLYGQDTWRALPQLTLTYGVRWDVDFSPTFGGGLQPLSATSAGFTDPTTLDLAPEGTPLFKTTYNNFAPRVGAAYQLRQKKGWETVLRGGFGVFYDLASQGVGQQIQVGRPPFGNQSSFLGPIFGGIFGPSAAFPLPPAQAAPPVISRQVPVLQNLPLFDPELKQPYSLQWNVAAEQSLGANQTFTAAYVAAVGRRLLRQRFIPGIVSPPGTTGLLFFQPTLVDNTSTSDYHSMQLQFQRRLSRGLQALASYTWAHSIDTASTGQSAIDTSLNIFTDGGPDRGNSDFDIRHTLTAAVSYNLPTPFENRALRAVLGGWGVDNIFTARTAPPVTIESSCCSSRPDLVPGVPLYLSGDEFPGGRAINPAAFSDPPVDASGFRALRQGTVGRNTVRGFGAWQLDLSLRRQFSLTERFKLQFRSDFFNVFNHPNFGQPANNLTFSTFGRAQSMLGRSLGQGGGSGGFNPLFQIGGPRSTQLSVKLLF
ncbi:MAG: TonB-dependent receptor [Pyrinomonadaceae bacterium]|nr:TonB-dependent receptor [Pyrinomonadaceae bacterium]